MIARRRVVVGMVLGAGGLIVRGARAQPARLARIGVLTESWGPTPEVVGLRAGLQELGYREDEHFTLGVRFTGGRVADLPAAARDLVRHRVDVIVTTINESAAQAAQAATRSIPIVFVGAGDPIRAGLVRSFARPGGNITGIADQDIELTPKRMDLFRELVPGLKRVLAVYDATNRAAVDLLSVHRDVARRLGLALLERPVRSEQEARATIGGLRREDADGVISLRSLALNISGLLLELAQRGVLPTMFHIPFFVERGGLASYSASERALGRQAARLVDKILKGARPADLPVEQPTTFEFVVNRKTAAALGLSIPASLLARIDRLVE